MSMIVFTYDDGEKIATVSYTPEYGFIAAGDHEILDRMSYEERQPRVPEPPARVIDDSDDDEPSLDLCASCGYPEDRHADNPHGCRSFA